MTLPLLLLLLLLWLAPAAACDETQTWYLDAKAGSDANTCHSPEAACKSLTRLQEILNQATPGTVMRLKRGSTWSPTTRLDLKTSGTEGAPIILEAYGEGALPILDGQQLPGGTFLMQCKRAAWYILRDLQLQFGKGAFAAYGCKDLVFDRVEVRELCVQECLHLKYDGTDAISQRITIQNSTIDVRDRSEALYIGTDPQQDGGKPDLTRDITLANSRINGGPAGECVEMKDGTANVRVIGNVFSNVGISVNGCVFSGKARPETPPGNHVVEGNTFYNVYGAEGYAIRMRNHATIRGNVIYQTSRDGVLLEQPADRETYARVVEHNTVLYATGAGITAAGSQTTSRNNIVWQSGSGNDPADPAFVNPAAGDLRLKAGSPAILRGAFPTPAPQ
jgi:hypothetical protein